MRISVYLPLLLSLALTTAAPLMSRYLAPALATRTLTATATAAIAAAASTWGLTLLSLTLLIDTPVAQDRLAILDPVPTPIAAAAAIMLAYSVWRGMRTIGVRRRTEREMRAVCALCQPHGEVAVVTDDAPHAYAVPGRPGRILISTGLLRTADATDRRVVLAHERAHLHHGHHRYRAVVDLAAAVNPLLAPNRAAVAYLVERWADEAAATVVGSRPTTARSLVKIALSAPPSDALTALAFHRHAVTERVRALQAPPGPSVRTVALACSLPAALAALAAGDATLAFLRLLVPLLGL